MKMKKRYFTEYWEDSVWAGYLEAKEEDIEKVVDLVATVYVPKEDIDNFEEYRIESEMSDEIMSLEDAEGYIFLHINELTDDERLYLFEREFTHLIDLDATENVDLDSLTDKEYDDLAIKIFSKLEESIIKKMKGSNAIEGRDMEWHEIYRWWDGSNWRTEILNHYYYDTCWEEVTEELKGMEEIDFKREKYGQYHLYKLKDGRRMIEYCSYWQGHGSKTCFIDKEVDTIEEALKVVEEKDRRLFPEKYKMG